MKSYYTYSYLRKDGTPYYIGKGCDNRAYVKEHGSVYPPRDKTRIIFLHQDCSENQALAFEIFWIAVYGRIDNGTGILRNKTNGGDRGGGQVVSVETRKKMSDSAKKRPPNQTGLKRSQEQIENIKRGRTEVGKILARLGAIKGGLTQKGKPKPKYECPHCKKMIAANMFDRYHNDNCKSKISKSDRRNPLDCVSFSLLQSSLHSD